MTGPALCEEFTGEGCERTREVAVWWPDEPCQAGTATRILYRSDKWGRGPLLYEHRTSARVIVDRAQGAEILGDLGTAPPARLRARPPGRLAQLCDVVELDVRLPSGEELVIECEDSPPLVAWETPSGRHVLAVLGRPVIVLRGPSVTSRGLVG